MPGISLWVEAYRPATLKGYVFKDHNIERKVKEWLANPDKKRIPIPHILLTGVQGTGKTTLARIIVKELGVDKSDVMEINASRESNVETVRSKIVTFCSTWPNGAYKVIILDEFDGFGHAAQRILRGEMEKYAETVRFIATGNYANKILPAILSRFQSFHFDALDSESYFNRLIEILGNEKVTYEMDDLIKYYHAAYPDLRKGINLLELHTHDGKLYPLEDAATSLDYMNDCITLFQERKFTEARKLICSQARTEDYEDIYRFLYKNPEMFGSDPETQSQAIIVIARYLYNHAVVADAEINLAACIAALSRLRTTQ
jgi:replication factor C small subunit